MGFFKKTFCLFLALLLAIGVFSIAPNIGQVAQANQVNKKDQSLFITEIMYDAPGSDVGNEYVEISNVSNQSIDISGYYIGDAVKKGSKEGMFQFPEGSSIGAGKSIVVAQSAILSKEMYGKEDFDFKPDYELPQDPTYNPKEDPDVPTLLKSDWATGYMVLSQSGDDVLLMDKDQQVVDYVPYIKDQKFNGKTYKAAPGMTQHIQSLQRQYTTGDASLDFKPVYPTPGSYKFKDDDPTPFPGPVISHTLLITEVQYDAAFDEDTGEFIEFTNISDTPIDISGYSIGDAEFPHKTSDGEGMFAFPEGTVIKPYQPVVVARNALGIKEEFGVTPDFEFEDSMSNVPTLQKNTDWTDGMVKLANAGDQALIYDRDMKIVDAVVWHDPAPFPGVEPSQGSYNNGNAIERLNGKDTNDCSVDFVDQPNPSPGVLLFGPNADKSRIPDLSLPDHVLMPSEPETGMTQPPTVVAEGGDAANAPENTMAAFDKALETKASQIFLPIQETSDGKLIVMKDETLNRTTNGKGRVDRTTWSEIRKLDAGSWFDPAFSGEKVPLLSEALAKVKGKVIPVLQVEKERTATKVVELLEELDMTDIHIVSTNPRVISEVREMNRELRGGIIFHHTPLNRKQLEKIVLTTRKSGANVVILDQKKLTKQAIHYFWVRELTVWSIGGEDQNRAHTLIASGIGGIVSENPRAAIDSLSQYPNESIVQRPVIEGHRGVASGRLPENTMPAFEEAWKDGADSIETDIQETKDGHLILMHDFGVDRTTDGTGKVKDLTLSEIRKLNANYVNPEHPISVPTLEELLAWAKSKKKTRPIVLNLEIKGVGFEKKITDLVEKYNLEENVSVICFRLNELKEIRKLDQKVGLVWIYKGPSMVSDHFAEHAAKVAKESMMADVQLNPFGTVDVYPELVDYARLRGLILTVGGSDSEGDMKKALQKGYPVVVTDNTGIFSNLPDDIDVAPRVHIKKGESKKLNARITYLGKPEEQVNPYVQLINPNNGVIGIGKDSITLNSLSKGKAFVQAYYNYTLGGQEWHWFARPTEIDVR